MENNNDNMLVAKKILSFLPQINEILNNTKMEIEEKNGILNLVTNVDKNVEKMLVKRISEEFENFEIISEEQDSCIKNGFGNIKFVIDPIDGTTNFTNGWPFSVSIGIIINNELEIGIIYDVLEKKVYTGVVKNGVYVSNIDDVTNLKEVIKPKYEKSNIRKSIIAFDLPYGKNAYEKTQAMHGKMYFEGASIKTVGPISLDILKMALGKENMKASYYDAVIHMEVRAWDLCAATVILRILGGDIVDSNGNSLNETTLSNKDSKIAFIASGNEKIRNEIVRILK